MDKFYTFDISQSWVYGCIEKVGFYLLQAKNVDFIYDACVILYAKQFTFANILYL